MDRRVRRALIAALAIVFAVSLTVTVRRLAGYRAGRASYESAQALAGLDALAQLDVPARETVEPSPLPSSSATGSAERPAAGAETPDPYADALSSMDLTALRVVNGDVVGWLLIPGTTISYPLVQGTDDSHYLSHTWDGRTSAVGAIFLSASASRDLSDFHSLIYGHRMKNGSMFAGLKYFRDESYYQAHPFVYITDDGGTKRYEIFAAYEAATDSETYRVGQRSEKMRQAYIDYCLAQSRYETGVVPRADDRLITLSTCTGSGHATRWVVQARLTPEDAPAEAADVSAKEEDALQETEETSPETSN